MSKELDKYAKHLNPINILSAAEKAKHKSMELLEEQGITAVALYMSSMLAKSVKEMERFREI